MAYLGSGFLRRNHVPSSLLPLFAPASPHDDEFPTTMELGTSIISQGAPSEGLSRLLKRVSVASKDWV
ncbi:hypothetical protein KY285_015335 [Solanum tuberosum]|nr:hypothetical protein KY285_015335 [Solanum tuberosum]